MERYTNVLISGMNYESFVMHRAKKPPFTINTRVYSNMLIKTDIPFRNKLFYNDDTDLCLQVLKAGFCTILFNAFVVYICSALFLVFCAKELDHRFKTVEFVYLNT